MRVERKIRGICFDLFNTLVSVAQVPQEVGAHTVDILGVDREQWRRVCFSENHEICQPSDAYQVLKRLAHSLNPAISETTLNEAVRARQRRFDYALIHVDPQVTKGLQCLLQRGIRLALVSNASTAEVAAWKHSPLAAYFDPVVFSCECGSKKPQGGIYQLALRGLNLSADACLFVGDGGSDEHQGAHAVGLQPVLISRYLSALQLQMMVEKLAEFQPLMVQSMAQVVELCPAEADVEGI